MSGQSRTSLITPLKCPFMAGEEPASLFFKMKSKKVSMLYELSKEEENSSLKDKLFKELEKKLKNSRNIITSLYNININICSSLSYEMIRVNFEESENGDLENGLKEYFTHAGIPSFVEFNSDYNLVDKILLDYGKTLKRKSNGFFVGKCVVDKKEFYNDLQLAY